MLDELITENRNTYYSWNLFNKSKNYRTKDLMSPNLKFLSLDKSSRSFVNNKLSSTDLDFNAFDNYNLARNNIFGTNTNLFDIYSNSNNYWNSSKSIRQNTFTNLNSQSNVNSIHSNNPLSQTHSFDRLLPDSQGEVSEMLKCKEESAPGFIFDSYWYSHYKNLSLLSNYNSIIDNLYNIKKSSLPNIVEYSEYDFRNW
jgi:hypothetical protein